MVEFRVDDWASREVHEVYGQAQLCEVELDGWPQDGRPPPALEKVMHRNSHARRFYGCPFEAVGSTSLTMAAVETGKVVAPPWVTAVDPRPLGDGSDQCCGLRSRPGRQTFSDFGE